MESRIVRIYDQALLACSYCGGEVASMPFDRGENEKRRGVGEVRDRLHGEVMREIEVVVSEFDFGEKAKCGAVVRLCGENDTDGLTRLFETSEGQQVSCTLLGVVGGEHDCSDRIATACVEETAVSTDCHHMIEDGVARALQAALEGSPDDVDVRLHLVDRLLTIDDALSALPHVQELLARASERDDVVDLGIRVLRNVGDEKTASALESARDADRRRIRKEGEAEEQEAVEPDVRRAMPVTGDDATLPIPDTADELLDKWDESEAPEEVVFGELAKAGITLDDVGGLEQVKKQLHRSFLGPMRNPELAAAFKKSAGGGLLLWGPPGCGKTFLARAIAGEMGANFYNVGLADILDMWIGASERNLASVFETARRNAPCVLFFDEIDALGQKRSHLTHAAALRGVVNQLLSELDGVADNNDGVFTLAATNHPWDVDEALLRPGRFDRRLLVLPPDAAARKSILEFHLQDRPTTEVDLSSIIEATDGWSGADLAFIVESAVEQCLDESLDAGEIISVTTAHLLLALSEVPSTIGPWLEGARNHVVYSNRSGEYDELETYLNSSKSNRRKPPGFRR